MAWRPPYQTRFPSSFPWFDTSNQVTPTCVVLQVRVNLKARDVGKHVFTKLCVLIKAYSSVVVNDIENRISDFLSKFNRTSSGLISTLSRSDGMSGVNLSSSMERKFENYQYDQVLVELIHAASFDYEAELKFAPCNNLPVCEDINHSHFLQNNPYSYGCKSMSFSAYILEGEFVGQEVLVTREFSKAKVNPTEGAFMYPGRRCYVSGVVQEFSTGTSKQPFYYNLRASRVWRTPDLEPDTPIVVNERVHRYRGSMTNLSDKGKTKQAGATFDC